MEVERFWLDFDIKNLLIPIGRSLHNTRASFKALKAVIRHTKVLFRFLVIQSK